MSRFIIRAVATGLKFDLRADNGQAVATSEAYTSEAACRRGIESVRRNAPSAPVEDQTEPGAGKLPHPKFELYRDRSGAFRFRLKAANGRVVAVSEPYGSKSACLGGIESVKKSAAEPGDTLYMER